MRKRESNFYFFLLDWAAERLIFGLRREGSQFLFPLIALLVEPILAPILSVYSFSSEKRKRFWIDDLRKEREAMSWRELDQAYLKPTYPSDFDFRDQVIRSSIQLAYLWDSFLSLITHILTKNLIGLTGTLSLNQSIVFTPVLDLNTRNFNHQYLLFAWIVYNMLSLLST